MFHLLSSAEKNMLLCPLISCPLCNIKGFGRPSNYSKTILSFNDPEKETLSKQSGKAENAGKLTTIFQFSMGFLKKALVQDITQNEMLRVNI